MLQTWMRAQYFKVLLNCTKITSTATGPTTIKKAINLIIKHSKKRISVRVRSNRQHRSSLRGIKKVFTKLKRRDAIDHASATVPGLCHEHQSLVRVGIRKSSLLNFSFIVIIDLFADPSIFQQGVSFSD